MSYVLQPTIPRAVGRILADHGATFTLKRRTEGTTIAVKGKRLLLRIGDEAVGNSLQTRFRVKIGTAELLASAWSSKVPSPTGDTIVVDGRECAIIDVWPISDAGGTVLYELSVAG